MRTTIRHAAVFVIGLALTAIIARFMLPTDIDSNDAFFVFLVLFLIYMGVSVYLVTVRRKRSSAK